MKSLFLVGLLFLGACANTMSAYYGAITTAATITTAGAKMLDAYDATTQTAIRDKVASDHDVVAAKAALDEHLAKYGKAYKALQATSFIIQSANVAAPLVEAAKDKQKEIAGWVTRLYTAGTEVVSALGEMGIKVPVLGSAK